MTLAWILDAAAAVMLAVAAVSAGRLALARPWRPGSVITEVDLAHLLMAIAMAGMLASSLRTLPDAAWDVIFGLLTALFAFRVAQDVRAAGLRALGGGCCAPHLVHSASMLSMFAAIGPAAGMAGMGAGSGMMTPGHPTVAFLFALILIGYGILDLDQLSGGRHRLAGQRLTLAHAGLIRTPAPADADPATAAFAGRTAAGATAAPADPDVTPAISRAAGGGPFGRILLSPAAAVGGRIAMGVGMAFLLLIAL